MYAEFVTMYRTSFHVHIMHIHVQVYLHVSAEQGDRGEVGVGGIMGTTCKLSRVVHDLSLQGHQSCIDLHDGFSIQSMF